MKQIVFGLFAEGVTDYKFYPPLLERYLSHFCYTNGIDAEILQTISIQKSEGFPSGFIETMKKIERDYQGLSHIFIHNDADTRTLNHVLENKWQPWMKECVNQAAWLALVPIKMTESWMLADPLALQSTLIISERDVQEILGGNNPESIVDPKSRLREIMQKGRQRKRTSFEENLAKRIRIETLERLPSFQFLKSQIEERIR